MAKTPYSQLKNCSRKTIQERSCNKVTTPIVTVTKQWIPQFQLTKTPFVSDFFKTKKKLSFLSVCIGFFLKKEIKKYLFCL